MYHFCNSANNITVTDELQITVLQVIRYLEMQL